MNTQHTKKLMLVLVTFFAGVIALFIFLSNGVRTISSAETLDTGDNLRKVHPADRKFFYGYINDDIQLLEKSQPLNIATSDRKLFDSGYLDIVMKRAETSVEIDLQSVHPADRKFFTAAYDLKTASGPKSTIERVDAKLFDAGYIGIVWQKPLSVAPDLTGIHPAGRKFFYWCEFLAGDCI